MNHTIRSQPSTSPKLKQFQEFTFVSDSAVKFSQDSIEQLHLPPNSNFLSDAKVGDLLVVNRIYAPQNVTRQLKNLKFKPNKKMQLISRTDNGSVVVKLNNALVGMGTEIAQRIVVSLIGETKL